LSAEKPKNFLRSFSFQSKYREKKLGLGVLGLGEGRSIISAGVNSGLWQVARLCAVNTQLGAERCREFNLAVGA
jgi:hypothetical protein